MELDTVTAQFLLGLGTNIAATIIGVIVAIAIRDRYYFRRLYDGWEVRVLYGERELLRGGRSIDWNTAKTITESTAQESVLLKGIVSPYARLHCDLITEGRDIDMLTEKDVPKPLIGRRTFGRRRTYTIDLQRGEAKQLLTIEPLTYRVLAGEDSAAGEGQRMTPTAREAPPAAPAAAPADAQDTGRPLLLNFAHPLKPDQLAAVERLAGQPPADVRDEPTQTQIDPDRPLAEQARAVVDGFGLSPVEWQSAALLVNLPGFAPATGAVLAELHGRMGHFPAILRLRPVIGETPTRYEVAEIVNLNEIRQAARERRQPEGR